MGGPAGDLYVVIHVQDHPFFHRDGNDLYVEVPLNFSTVALGGEIRIPTLEGEEPFKVLKAQSGQAFRLRGRGMPDVTGRGRGDLFVTMKVTTPKKLTRNRRSSSSSSPARCRRRSSSHAGQSGRQGAVRPRQGHLQVTGASYLARHSGVRPCSYRHGADSRDAGHAQRGRHRRTVRRSMAHLLQRGG